MKQIARRKIAILAVLMLITVGFVIAEPLGTEPLSGTSTRRVDPTVQSLDAQAGNVTQVNIDAISITTGWQGYYGNVSAVITLDDVGGNTFYNWTAANPEGEIYAARVNSVNWTAINCTDAANITAEEIAMELLGASDSVTNTFNENSHAAFTTATRNFAANECNSTNPYNSTGGQDDFANVILTDGDDRVYATILETDANGFDGGTYDFQLLVAENGNGSNATVITPYYFFVELS